MTRQQVGIPISMGTRVMGEALGAWEEAAHSGGSLTGDQMGRIIDAGKGCAAEGAR